MYTEKATVFLYCVSPVHMGAGAATGVIDNPIQREIHTGHPSFAGSGIKGAVRHAFSNLLPEAAEQCDVIFGPKSGGDLHAGAASFGDAQLVAFPVRSMRQGFVHVTCPLALARAQRLLHVSGRAVNWPSVDIADGECLLTPEGMNALTHDDRLDLEVFQYAARTSNAVVEIGAWLADQALYGEHAPDYFHRKLADQLVVLSNSDFDHFVRHATLVEPHVRIDDETGTADGGGLFFTENLPPESLLIAPVMASRERREQHELGADVVMSRLRTALHGQIVQLGGDATAGRGLVSFNLVAGEG